MGLQIIENTGSKTSIVTEEVVKIAANNLSTVLPETALNNGAAHKLPAVFKNGGEYRSADGKRRIRATVVIPVEVKVNGQSMKRELAVYLNGTVDSLSGAYSQLDLQHGNAFTLAVKYRRTGASNFGYLAAIISDTGVVVAGFSATIKFADLSTIRKADRERKVRAAVRAETLSAFMAELLD